MPFSFSGRIAQGADEALEQVLERRMKEQIRQDNEKQRAADLIMRQQGQDLQRQQLEQSIESQRINQGMAQKRFDLDELVRRDELTEKQTNRNRASDQAAVLAMPGMENEDKIREISGIGMRAGTVDPEKVIANLRPVKPDMQSYTYINPTNGKRELRFFDKANPPTNLDMGREPDKPSSAGQGEHFWVNRKMPDGSVKETRVSDATYNPQTDEYFDAVQRRGQQKTETVHPQIISYSENLIRKIDDLVGRKDDPKTPDKDESLPNRITNQTAGVVGQVLGSDYFPFNTEAKNVKAEMFSVASELAISALQKMRASSATGGAVGNVALGEMEIMKNAVAAIQMTQSPEQLQRQLKIVRESEQRFLDAVRQDANAKMNHGDGIRLAPGGAPPGGKPKFTIIGQE